MIRKQTRFMRMLKKYWIFFLMITPGMLYLLINNYMPMIGLFIAFKKINYRLGIFQSPWCGLRNFKYLFNTESAWIITRNTLGYNISFIILNLVVAITIAILLNEITARRMRKVYQSVVLMPYLLSMIIVGYLAFALLSSDTGFFNKSILPALGMEEVQWYSEKKFWPFILTFVNTWKNAGYLCVVYYAAIIGVDREMYEAATIDGANRWQQIFSITLPSIRQIMIIMTLLQIGKIFYSDFGLFYQVPLNTGTLQSVTNTIDTFVYRALLQTGDIGMSSAAGFYQSIVGFFLVLISNLVVRRIDPDSALF